MANRQPITGVASDASIAELDRRRALPWTDADYDRLRKAAEALVRSRVTVHELNKRGLSVVDGPLLWRLLGALSRTTVEDE